MWLGLGDRLLQVGCGELIVEASVLIDVCAT